jgi:hypothetical protein
MLVTGEVGTGKTHAPSRGPRPIHFCLQ